MAVIKRIVCLANSRKHQGRCIVGRELVSSSGHILREKTVTTPWVRAT